MAKYLPIICKVLDLVARTASKKKEEVNYHQKNTSFLKVHSNLECTLLKEFVTPASGD